MSITEKRQAELVNELDAARAAVFVCAKALNEGESDLEIHSAKMLKTAFEAMNDVYDALLMLRIDTWRAQESAKAGPCEGVLS